MDFYIKEEDIESELEKRELDRELFKKIEEYLGEPLPEPFNQNKRFAVIVRHLFTPDYELEKFLEKAKKFNLEPVLLEYTEDKFVAENEDKRALGKLFFFRGIFRGGKICMDVFKIIDFDKNIKKKISEVKTTHNESLVDFHHRILNHFYPKIKENIFDYSEWFHSNGKNAKEYYKNFLVLFLKNAVLFDNFRISGEEGVFCRNVFVPAFTSVYDTLGFKPLIYPLQNIEDEDNPKWWGYPLDKKEKIIELSKIVE